MPIFWAIKNYSQQGINQLCYFSWTYKMHVKSSYKTSLATKQEAPQGTPTTSTYSFGFSKLSWRSREHNRSRSRFRKESESLSTSKQIPHGPWQVKEIVIAQWMNEWMKCGVMPMQFQASTPSTMFPYSHSDPASSSKLLSQCGDTTAEVLLVPRAVADTQGGYFKLGSS